LNHKVTATFFILTIASLFLHASTDPPRLSSGTYLFIDDHWIETTENVTRSLNQPVRHPKNPVLHADQPWEDGMVVLQPGTVIFDEPEKLFKMWYEAPTNDRDRNPSTFLCYATSRDGIEWQKPKIGLYEFQGSKNNNILFGAAQHGGNWFGHSVIKDNEDSDSARRYKAIFWDHSPQELHGMFVAFSPDGVRWTRYSKDPVIPAWQTSDTSSVMWDPKSREYVLFHKSPIHPVRKVARMVSKDFVHWEGGPVVLNPDAFDPSDTEFYGMSVFPYADRYLGLIWVFHTYLQRIDVQLASSFDTLNWHRVLKRRVFLPLGYMKNDYSGESFDSEMVFPASQVVHHRGQLLIYYSGFNQTHNFFNNKSGIGLATLRVDGFVSLDGAVRPGTVLTKPFIFDGQRLAANIEARYLPQYYGGGTVKAGEGRILRVEPTTGVLLGPPSDAGEADEGGILRVEIQDVNRVPVRGYELTSSDPVKSTLNHLLTWKGTSDLSHLRGKVIRLKFVVSNAKFYSFQIQ